mmetsp:Transcript_17331/g.19403  ORF Transcript_17331/g.19403 Transcript_17331/m.19403 type:complete len:231 (+) Transcript_17331:2220-2912(+)
MNMSIQTTLTIALKTFTLLPKQKHLEFSHTMYIQIYLMVRKIPGHFLYLLMEKKSIVKLDRAHQRCHSSTTTQGWMHQNLIRKYVIHLQLENVAQMQIAFQTRLAVFIPVWMREIQDSPFPGKDQMTWICWSLPHLRQLYLSQIWMILNQEENLVGNSISLSMEDMRKTFTFPWMGDLLGSIHFTYETFYLMEIMINGRLGYTLMVKKSFLSVEVEIHKSLHTIFCRSNN